MAGLARPVRTLAKLRRTLSMDFSMRSICTGSSGWADAQGM